MVERNERRVAMATTTRGLTRATGPLAFFEPGGPLGRRWFGELERFFNRELPLWPRHEAFEFGWVPELEVFERNNHLTVRVDLPGLKKEEVAVNVTEGVLTIEGERTHEAEEEKNHWYTRERNYGRFRRTVLLPEGVNAKEVTATFKGGVLEITVPRPVVVEAPRHKVEVRGAEQNVKEKVA
jgi:HSP20 family molecular chaperone IbpA